MPRGKGDKNMKPIETIKKNLTELAESGARYCLCKVNKVWCLTYKDNEKSKAEFKRGINDIQRFTLNKCIDLDSKTGIKVDMGGF